VLNSQTEQGTFMELIRDNYLRGSGTGSTWHVDIDPPTRKVKSYFEETLLTSEYMYANKTGKLLLMLSGGLDSEYVFRVFQHLKFEFTPVIVRLMGKHSKRDYNHADTVQGFKLCNTFNIKPLVIEFDFDKFFDSGEIFDLMHTWHCRGIGVITLSKIAESLDGFTVMGNDPPYMRLNEELNQWQLEEEELIHTLLRFYKGKNLHGCPFLLSYTPEMMLSFLLDPHIADLANGKHVGRTGTNSTKSYVFNNGSGFNMDHYDFELAKKVASKEVTNVSMPRYKQNGLEVIIKIPHFYKRIRQEMKAVQPGVPLYRGCYKENYHDLVKRLSIHQ
jgi:hypothetical protein